MDKFSKIKDKVPTPELEEVYTGDHISVLKYKNYELVKERDSVIILPYLVDEGKVILRQEMIPTYEYRLRNSNDYKNVRQFITCVAGMIDKGESPVAAIRRELYEESGIVLSSMFDINVEQPVFMNKGNAGFMYPVILEIRYNDYKQAPAPGDGSIIEKNSRSIEISIGDLDDLRIHDLQTLYLIEKFKSEYMKK